MAELGLKPSDTGLLMAVGRTAALWVEFLSATRDLDAARRAREAGRGKRPSAGAIDRLSHRAKVASDGYAEALSALKADPFAKQRQAEVQKAEMMARYRKPAQPKSGMTVAQAPQQAGIKELTG